MTLKEAMKLGLGFYIGYKIAEGLDLALGQAFTDSGLEDKIRAKLEILTEETKAKKATNKV